MALTIRRISKLIEAGRYSDGGNLFLQVTPTGGKSWLFKYQLRGQTREMGLGPLRDVTLQEARDAALAARKLKRSGVDPIEARRSNLAALVLEAAKSKTFEQAAQEYFDGHASQWTNLQYRQKFLSSLKAYAFKKIGKLPVAAIDTPVVLKVIEPIWLTKPDTANRVRNRIESVLDWATVRGLRTGDNPARWAVISKALPEKTKVTKHHVALPYKEVPAFVAKLGSPAYRGAALEFLILTAARSGEVIGARWSEIDFEKKLWIIPGPRMKEKREHRVPLVDRAIQILKGLPREGDFIFIGSRKNMPLGKNTFYKLLDVMKHGDITTHGFRSSFRDWAGEETSFPADIAEVALSHVVGSSIQTTYQRGDLLEKRRHLMEAWATFCSGSTPDVVDLNTRRNDSRRNDARKSGKRGAS